MKYSYNNSKKNILKVLPILVLVSASILLVACSAQTNTEAPNTTVNNTNQLEIEPTPASTLPPLDGESLSDSSELELDIDRLYSDLNILVDYIKDEAPTIADYLNIDDVINNAKLTGHTHGETDPDNTANEYSWVMHEIGHSLKLKPLYSQFPVWLTEGFSVLLYNNVPIYLKSEKQCVFEDLSSDMESGFSDCYFLDSEQFSASQKWYLAQGGQMDTEDSVDPSLYIDAVSFATLNRATSEGYRTVPLGELYETYMPQLYVEGQIGLELSTTQATSFLTWLGDSYSIDQVLDMYINGVEAGLLDGKTYDELKADWQTDLVSRAGNIEIPGLP